MTRRPDTAGRARFARFTALACVAYALLTGCPETPADPQPETRPFAMGFTTWPLGPELADIEQTIGLIHQHGDLIAFHLDQGVPWAEALAGGPYPAQVEADLAGMAASVGPGQQVYVGLAPLSADRAALAPYWAGDDNLPLPAPWDGYGFDATQVLDAYTNFCLHLIERLDPDYVNFGIEVTEAAVNAPDQWPAVAPFMRAVYQRLKAAHPDLPCGFSAGFSWPETDRAALVDAAIGDVIGHTDYLGVSTYPYAAQPGGPGQGDPAAMHPAWLTQAVDAARGKPIAICETGYAAEPVVIPEFGWDIPGSPAWQRAYAEKLLPAAAQHDALFVIWWCVADFDRLMPYLPEAGRPIARIWRDTGLYDGALRPRPAMTTWDAWLARPRR